MSTGWTRLKIAGLKNWMGQKSVRRGLRVVFAITVTSLLIQLKLEPAESVFYDWRSNLIQAPAASGNVVMVGVDGKTLRALKHAPTAKDFTTVLNQLSEAHPRFLVSTINPTEVPGSAGELKTFAATAEHTRMIFADNDLPAPGHKSIEPLVPPFDKVDVGAAPTTRDSSMFIPRGVSRRVILRYQENWTLQADIARAYNGFDNIRQFHGVFYFLDSDQAYVKYKTGYQHLSFSDVLAGNFDHDALRGRVVLIGRNSKDLAHTFLVTPITRNKPQMSLLELQANYIDSLITNSSPRLTPLWLTSLLTFLFSILTMIIVMRMRPVRGLFALMTAGASLVFSSLFLAWAFNCYFAIAPPAFGIVICYYFSLPYRLILENRKSWEFQEKNRLLLQVEELKSNFIRLMSHDLKTPIARIQAMAEIVGQKKQSLSREQIEALDNITYSTEELSQFITSILSLSRIESQRVKLRLQTHDINLLLQKVVRNSDHLARRKNIQLTTELEPLFSLRMDEDLMKQVFTNLVENAIKYSPENTKVIITAREFDGRIQIAVKDQGIGIPENELSHVFDKFYRAQNAEYENNGTGLGLYLAKYFVQLHNGTIQVESVAHQGSTFAVNLPLDMEDERGAAHV